MKTPTFDDILPRLVKATPEQLQAVSAVLDGEPPPVRKDVRLNTPAQAARRIGCHRVALWRRIKRGDIAVVYVGVGKRTMIPETALEAYASGIGGTK